VIFPLRIFSQRTSQNSGVFSECYEFKVVAASTESEADPASGEFSVTDGKLTCVGSYDPLNHSQTITATVTCNDGRTGIAIATRDSPTSGGGKVTLSDGSEGTFIFGAAASKI